MKKEISKSQTFEYFEGKSNLYSKKKIEDWLKYRENQEQYYVWLEEFERKNLIWDANSSQEFYKIKLKTLDKANTEKDEMYLFETPSFRYKKLSIAAMIAGAILICGMFFRDEIIYKTYLTSYGSKQNIILDDGSVVNLNSNSKLIVPRFGFGENSRDVSLIGEAFFRVTHTKSHQKFVVNTNQNFRIEVLGTEFDVFNGKDKKQVVLEKGKVKIYYGIENEHITMKPGDKVTLNLKGNAILEKTNNPKIYSSWRKNLFVFDKTSLTDVGQLIYQNFGHEVVFSNALADRTLSGEIEAKSEQELLDALAQVFDLRIVRKNNKIEIK